MTNTAHDFTHASTNVGDKYNRIIVYCRKCGHIAYSSSMPTRAIKSARGVAKEPCPLGEGPVGLSAQDLEWAARYARCGAKPPSE